ncbi:hypothetical protein PAAG_07100 [Paracoccidioides lutzii Pb01]|uniref:Integral membrane protein n=1 Tax=Paracoccidioides lutzii (strain ATCC MYA-826 / Pb01) TaxID=502779 RepID=C1H8K9_PARBA|nr:hypothetical protein PAAG_07100 [Paracoccidioides lutzii Pb01]EEH36682.1 hypothetical protein PAAG_07100 [Paracoccidioides lutzii Pb01]
MRISIGAGGPCTVIAAARTTTSRQTTRGPRYYLSCQDIHRICRVGVGKGKGSGRERQRRREIKREFHSTSTSSSARPPDSSLLGQISRTPPSPSPLSPSSATGPSSVSSRRIERTCKPAHGNSSGPSSNDGMINCSDKASSPSPPPPQWRKQERDQESDQEQIQDLRPVEQTTINPTSAQISAGASIPAITFPTPTPSTTTTDNTNTTTIATITTPSTPSQPPSPPRTLRQIIKSTSIGRAADFYSRMQSRRPYWTQLWCTLFIYLCGDLSAQFLVEDAGKEKEKEKHGVIGRDGAGDRDGAAVGEGLMARYGYDPLRTVRHLTVGAVAAVPSYRWFMFLHNNFNYARSKLLSILTKVSINQAIFTPIFNTYFFSMQSLLAGTSLQDTWERLKLALPISVMNSAKLWPAITAFTFMYVDPQFRSIFAGSIAVGWQAYLSWLNQKAARDIGSAVQGEELMGRRSGGGVRATTLATPAVSV